TRRTIPLPGGQAVVLLGFDGLDAAVQAVGLVMQTPAVSCDLLDRRLLALARSVAPVPLPASVEAALLVEFEGESPAEARDQALALADRVKRQERGAVHSRVAAEPEEVERIWKVRESALPGLY